MARLPLLLALPALAAQSGCVGAAAIVYDGSRQASSEVIGQTLAETAPGIDQTAGAKCIVSAMSYTEVIRLGASDSTRVTPRYRAKVAEVRGRDGVAECLAAAGTPA